MKNESMLRGALPLAWLSLPAIYFSQKILTNDLLINNSEFGEIAIKLKMPISAFVFLLLCLLLVTLILGIPNKKEIFWSSAISLVACGLTLLSAAIIGSQHPILFFISVFGVIIPFSGWLCQIAKKSLPSQEQKE